MGKYIGVKIFGLIMLILIILFSVYKSHISNNRLEEIYVETVASEEVIEDNKINISVIGDIMCHNTQYNDAYNPVTGEYDFAYVFEDIKEYMQKADLAIGNLETTFGGKEKGYSSFPFFNTPDVLAYNLKELGLDVLSTANNHSLDSGYDGLARTIEVLNNAGISHVGTYSSNEEAEQILIKEINNIKIAFLSYSYGTNGLPLPSGKEYCINLIEDEKIVSDILKAKEKADLIAVIIHWGDEYKTSSNNEQKRIMELMFENGVTLIFGSHPHVLQEMGTFDYGRETFAIFSLGNFVSGQVREHTKQSIILNLDIIKKPDGEIIIDNINYTPIYTHDRNGNKKYKIMDIEKEIEKYESGDTSIGAPLYNTLKKELEQINGIMTQSLP